MFVTPYPTLFKTHILKCPVYRAADSGVKEVELETRPTDAMVGGTGAAGPAPDLRHQLELLCLRICFVSRTGDILVICM